MKKAILLSSVCACVLALGAEDLGEIYVESSTIDDKFDTTMYDVSSTDVMDESEVESFHAENIANVLNTIPRVTVRENENDSNKIHIRGIAAEMYMGEKPGVARHQRCTRTGACRKCQYRSGQHREYQGH